MKQGDVLGGLGYVHFCKQKGKIIRNMYKRPSYSFRCTSHNQMQAKRVISLLFICIIGKQRGKVLD